MSDFLPDCMIGPSEPCKGYSQLRERAEKAEQLLNTKPSSDVQSVIDSLNQYCGITPAQQREVAKFIEFLVRENARQERKAEQRNVELEQELAEARKTPDYEAWDASLREGWRKLRAEFDAIDAAIADHPDSQQ